MEQHANKAGAFTISGGEIIAILVFLVILAILAIGFVALIYVIVRAIQTRPQPAPPSLPPEALLQSQQKRDLEQLKLLSIFHFVFGGLALLGMAFLFVHYTMMHIIFSNPNAWKSQNGGPPKEFFQAFIWFYLFFGVVLLVGLALNVISGVFLGQKRNRIFSMIVAGIDCLQIPFGTVLGVFTIMVLSRDTVRELYSAEA